MNFWKLTLYGGNEKIIINFDNITSILPNQIDESYGPTEIFMASGNQFRVKESSEEISNMINMMSY